MAAGDLIDFEIIENQKENIQSLPGGRSARKLVEAFSPSPLHKLSTPTPTDTKNINDCIRAEYEEELANLSECDDPLDIFDRYVRWTFDAYPSAQATPQSQLHTLLERATKTFIGSAQYKNDPRYLKLWLHYTRFFSDAPRETFVFLSRHSIGEGLALFYEEYAEWLESAGRWSQAEEVYKLGIEREARPTSRLIRKFGEFEKRREQHQDQADEPSSPALPTVRPALAAKIDPYAAARAADPQAPRANMGVGGATTKSGKPKLAVFSDSAEPAAPAMSSATTGAKGWDTIGSLADRKKENVMEAKPWVGETLDTSVKKSSGPKMAIFRDPSMASRIAESHIVIAPSKHQVIVNPQNGKRERVFVNLEVIYPAPEEPGTELSFEELWAGNRGWLDACWDDESIIEEQSAEDFQDLSNKVSEKLVIHRDSDDPLPMVDENGAVVDRAKPAKASKKKKMMEVNETQVIKANLDSPSKPKMKKKKKHSSEPTMTMHTKAATDEIYDIFNAPLKPAQGIDEGSEDDDDDDYETDYASGAESTGETREISMLPDGEDEENEYEANQTQASHFIDDTTHVPSSPMAQYPGDDTNGLQGEYSPPHTRFVPIPPEDYDAPTRPYRDPVEVANNRLPFMTPITEVTESGVFTEAKSRLWNTKTPSKGTPLDFTPTEEEDEDDELEEFEPLSSPIREVLGASRSPLPKIPQPLLQKTKPAAAPSSPVKKPKSPIIKDLQCNPVEPAIRQEILESMQPSLNSYSGFYDHRSERFSKGPDIRKYTKALSKTKQSTGDKTGTLPTPVVLEFPELMAEYTVKRELGAGAYAPVYLVENSSPEDAPDSTDEPAVAMGKGAFAVSRRAPLEALKMEQPPTAWEFHIMRLAATRLGPQDRTTASVSPVHELHLYQDDGYLFLPYHPYGTLLDVVNFFRAEQSGVMEESLAMFFTIELLRTVEALHAKQILHGDLKADNCLLRLEDLPEHEPLAGQWRADGSGGWAQRGVVLIDFGRGIDMRAFDPSVQFIADWRTTAQDCAEMREGRPWTWQIDYHGLAGTIHTLLFGRYIETARADSGGIGSLGGRRYRVREPFKRYWQQDLWADCFDLLLNPQAHVEAEDGRCMPVNRGLRRVRGRMEAWLEANCEKGVGLRGLMARVESMARPRR